MLCLLQACASALFELGLGVFCRHRLSVKLNGLETSEDTQSFVLLFTVVILVSFRLHVAGSFLVRWPSPRKQRLGGKVQRLITCLRWSFVLGFFFFFLVVVVVCLFVCLFCCCCCLSGDQLAHTNVTLVGKGSVHSGSASCDDCGRVLPWTLSLQVDMQAMDTDSGLGDYDSQSAGREDVSMKQLIIKTEK